MKYTILYLKYTLAVVLLLIVVISLILGILCAVLGILVSTQQLNPGFLVLIPVGVFCGFIGFAAFDGFKALIKKWGLEA